MKKSKHGHLLTTRNPDGSYSTWRSSTYMSWSHMRSRCYKQSNAAYADYGGRGITVCDRWMTFENFLADMGVCPAGCSIERLDNNKGYEPSNCVWATPTRQARNRRSTKLTSDQVGQIRNLLAEGVPQRLIAKEFNITQAHVSGIYTGLAWKGNA